MMYLGVFMDASKVRAPVLSRFPQDGRDSKACMSTREASMWNGDAETTQGPQPMSQMDAEKARASDWFYELRDQICAAEIASP